MYNNIISQRQFSIRIIQLFAFGGFSHFSLSRNAVGDMVSATINTNCLGGFPSADICSPPEDLDYCPGEKPPADECPDGMPPEDGCAGGVPAEDLCHMHLTGSDECDPSISGSDQGGCKSDSDECSFFGLADACTWGLNKDIAE